MNSKAEKERDMARGDCKKLEEERDGLRQKLKVLQNFTENIIFNI